MVSKEPLCVFVYSLHRISPGPLMFLRRNFPRRRYACLQWKCTDDLYIAAFRFIGINLSVVLWLRYRCRFTVVLIVIGSLWILLSTVTFITKRQGCLIVKEKKSFDCAQWKVSSVEKYYVRLASFNIWYFGKEIFLTKSYLYISFSLWHHSSFIRGPFHTANNKEDN